ERDAVMLGAIGLGRREQPEDFRIDVARRTLGEVRVKRAAVELAAIANGLLSEVAKPRLTARERALGEVRLAVALAQEREICIGPLSPLLARQRSEGIEADEERLAAHRRLVGSRRRLFHWKPLSLVGR